MDDNHNDNGSKLDVPNLIPWKDNGVVEDKEEEKKLKDHIISELNSLDDSCKSLYGNIRSMALEGSQYGDGRCMSAICTSRRQDFNTSKNCESLIATGGWSGSIKLWDGSSSAMNLLSTKAMAHEDRIMGIAMASFNDNGISNADNCSGSN